MQYRVIVAHPEQQHSFRIASALKKNGMLCKYVTTVYNKKTSLLMRTTKLFLSKDNLQRANNRINPDLTDDDVVQYCELLGLLQIALYRFDSSKRLYNWWHKNTSRRFGKKVAKLAIRENVDAVILYDANAMTCFRYLQEHAPQIKRIMDTSAANRLFMKKIYEDDIILCTEFADRLRKERDFLWRSNYCDLLQQELEATQYFIVPSEFVKKSLLYSHIKEEQIKICPYGSNFEIMQRNKVDAPPQNRPLHAVYVGNITEMKGIFYLLQAIMQFPQSDVELTLVGAYNNDDGLFDPYLSRVSFVGRVPHDKVRDILMESDIFVFPSLGEGMSLSVLEAMSCGLPCIVSENSGVSEVIHPGENGFVIPVQNTQAIADCLKWFILHKSDIPMMRKAALDTVSYYSWDNYNNKVIQIIGSIIEKNLC